MAIARSPIGRNKIRFFNPDRVRYPPRGFLHLVSESNGWGCPVYKILREFRYKCWSKMIRKSGLIHSVKTKGASDDYVRKGTF